MFEEEVRIKIRSELFEVEESLFSDLPEDEDEIAICKWDDLPATVQNFFLEYFDIEDFSEIREIDIK